MQRRVRGRAVGLSVPEFGEFSDASRDADENPNEALVEGSLGVVVVVDLGAGVGVNPSKSARGENVVREALLTGCVGDSGERDSGESRARLWGVVVVAAVAVGALGLGYDCIDGRSIEIGGFILLEC